MTQPFERGAEADPTTFVNTRGEIIDARRTLLDSSERGQTWSHWTAENAPWELFIHAGLWGQEHPDTAEWFNVVEHTAKVAGTSLALAEMLRARGVQVDTRATVRAAMVHDLTKRGAVAQGMTREHEDKSQLLPTILKEYGGYSELEIGAASNTGRLADRYIEDPGERMAAIRERGVEAAIVGLTDAMMRGTSLLTLEEARDKNIEAKPDPRSHDFFANRWYPYYTDVVRYLGEQAPGFDINELTEDAVFGAVQADTGRLPAPAVNVEPPAVPSHQPWTSIHDVERRGL